MPIATKNINAEKIQGNLDITSVTSSFTGSYIGDGAGIFGIISSSYALTASYAMNGGGGGLTSLSAITSGSATASVSPDFGFIVNTKTTITSSAPDIFLIKNALGINMFTVSQSGVIILATHSAQLTDPAPVGAIYFTSSSMYIGLET